MRSAHEVPAATVGGMAWSVASTVGGRVISLASLAILARLLAPHEFGLLAFALAFLAYLETVGDLGTGAALIYWPERWRDVAQLTFLANLIMGVTWVAVTWAGAPFVARFFDSPEGEGILRALAWVLLLKALGTTHDALLQRELRFRSRAAPELALMGAKALVAVPLAIAGLGAWSLVWGQIVGQAAYTALVWSRISWRPERRFPRDMVRPVLGYGSGIVGVNILAAVLHHADVVVVGRMLGTAALGFYQMAYRVPDMAITLLVRTTGKVLFPAMSRLHGAGTGLRDLYLSALRYLSLLTVPASVGLILLADPLVGVFFGERWRPSVPILRALAAYGGIRALGSYAGDVLKATGRPHVLSGLGVLRAVVLVPALVLAGTWGSATVALTLAGEAALSTAVYIAVAARLVRSSVGDLAVAFGPAVLASVPMALFLWLWGAASGPLPDAAVLGVGIAGGAGLYGLALRLMVPSIYRDAVSGLRRARSSRREKGSGAWASVRQDRRRTVTGRMRT